MIQLIPMIEMTGKRRRAWSWCLSGVVALSLPGAAGAAPADPASAGSRRIETVAGTGQRGYSGDGGSARSASFFEPAGVSVDGAGTLYVADTLNHRVRRVDPSGTVTTLAGTGVAGGLGDGGPAAAAELAWPHGTALGPGGTVLFVADSANHRIRRIDLSTGVITTVAGNGTPGFAGDGGPATAALLSDPKAVAVSPTGELWIADTGNDRVRRVDAGGVVTTVAGTGSAGLAGDGGPATAALLDGPRSLAFGPGGDAFVADDNNDRVRRIDGSGVITTVAGGGPAAEPAKPGRPDQAGDGGPATAARLARPRGVAVDSAGRLYIADSANHRLRVVGPDGVITTWAGIGREGYGGDGGPATDAKLFLPRGVAVDAAGAVLLADTNNSRIRRIVP